MRRRTIYTEELDGGPDIVLEYEPVDGTLLQAKIADKYVVAYLVYDSDGFGCNPLKDWDGNGELITSNQGVITDGNACIHLGLEELGGRFHDANKDFDLDGIEEEVITQLRTRLQIDNDLRVWYVKLRLELDEEPLPHILDALQGYWNTVEWSAEDEDMLTRLDSWGTLAEAAWDKLYAEGKLGTYLAVPVRYDDNCHGPGTTQISTTDIDNANAVWIPGENEIANMNFTGCVTYFDKLAVADKYAQSCLDEYEKWCNGEVYGCVCHVYAEDGELQNIEIGDECWGFIGWEHAEEALRTEFFEPTCKRVQEQYDHDVRTQCDKQMEMAL